MLGKKDLEQNLRLLPYWAARFEVPDVNYFRDIVWAPHVFLEFVSQRLAVPKTDPFDWFPYPKGGGKFRNFVLLSPADLVLARTFAGEIAARVDLLLPSAVFSNRLASPPPAWKFRSPREAHKQLRSAAKTLANRHHGMTKTDVANFYPTMDLEILRINLLAWGCDPSAVAGFLDLASGWQARGCTGIPVGGEAFGVFGNAYVLPLDVRLAALGVPYLRWVDDIYFFGRHLEERVGAVEVADQEFSLLAIERSREKTRHFNDRASAIAEVEDGMLTSLFESGPGRRGSPTTERLRDRFLEFVVEASVVQPRQVRALFRGLEHRRDPFATPYLIANTALMNIDPLVVGDYLHAVPPSTTQGLAFIDLLARTSFSERDVYDARDLHLLRALASRTWGQPEGRTFWGIGLDSTRRGSVRAWAIVAAARTPAWSLDDVLERTLEEVDLRVRRALVLTLWRARDDARVQGFLRHIRARVPDLIPCAAWVDAGLRPGQPLPRRK